MRLRYKEDLGAIRELFGVAKGDQGGPIRDLLSGFCLMGSAATAAVVSVLFDAGGNDQYTTLCK